LTEIRLQVAKALYRNTVTDLFGRLKSPRKGVMSKRHVEVLKLLLKQDDLSLTLVELMEQTVNIYTVKNPRKALIRDLSYLIQLEAIAVTKLENPIGYRFRINLEWPTQITETEFFRRVKEMPRRKSYAFLSS
jgi:hypothetical protein